MKSFLFLVLFAFASQTQAQEIRPPQDADRIYVTVFGTKGEARFEAVKGWFAGSLKNTTNHVHFNAFNTEHTMFKERYAKTVGDLPCIRVQDAHGKVLYQASDKNLPTQEALAAILKSPGIKNCPWRNDSKPDVEPEPDPEPDVVPDKVPDTEPEPSGLPGYVYLLVALVAGGLAASKKFKEQYSK